MEYLQIGDSTIAYEHEISGDGANRPTVLFCHALATHSGIWAETAQALAPIADTLVFDLPGHGNSSRGACQGFAFADLAGIARTLLDHLGITQVHLIGVSVGGEVAQAFAALYPERLARMVLSSTACHTSPERAALWSERLAEVERVGMAGIAAATAARWFSPDFASANPGAVQACADAIGKTDAGAYARLASVIARMDLRSSNPTIGAPTLITYGTLDHNTGRAAAALIASTINGARSAALEGCGHFPHLEKPAEWRSIVMDFLFGLDDVKSVSKA